MIRARAGDGGAEVSENRLQWKSACQARRRATCRRGCTRRTSARSRPRWKKTGPGEVGGTAKKRADADSERFHAGGGGGGIEGGGGAARSRLSESTWDTLLCIAPVSKATYPIGVVTLAHKVPGVLLRKCHSQTKLDAHALWHFTASPARKRSHVPCKRGLRARDEIRVSIGCRPPRITSRSQRRGTGHTHSS